MNYEIMKAIGCGVVSIAMVSSISGVGANALEWSEPELSSISVYSGNSRSLEVTVPLGYEFTIDDVEDLNFTKTYESTATTLTGKTEYKYDTKHVSFEDIQKDCKITTQFQYKDELTDKFIVSVNYIGDEVESVGIINSLWITIHYDINDLSLYGDNYLTTDTILSVNDGEYSKDYLFNGSETLEENPTDSTLPTIEVTEDNNKFLFDCGAFYVKANYNFTYHWWAISTERKILKEDTIISEISGYISELNSKDFTVTFYDGGSCTYPINADYVYIPEDIDINNYVTVIAYNTTTDDWYTNPYRIFVEPSHKVTLTGTVVSTDGGVKVDFGGYTTTVPVSANVGDTVVATNYGDCIDDGWMNTASFEVIHNSADNITIGDSNKEETLKRGDINGDDKVNVIDLLQLKKYVLHIIDEEVPNTGDINDDGKINVLDLVQLKKYILQIIDTLN